jgi:arsenate reductase (glutaredoxin)
MKSKIKVYEYNKCSTCQKALKFLDSKKVVYDKISIVDRPPTTGELKQMLKYLKADGGSFKSLFNTSGVQYRELNMSEKIKNGLGEDEAIQLLSQNGKLIKRPFLLVGDTGTVGFQDEKWKKIIAGVNK